MSAGETLPAATFDAWHDATGIRLMDGIGSTEMLHIFVGSPVAEVKSGSTGKVVPGYRAKVVDEHGQEVPRGRIGRLAVSGPTGCRYLDDLESQRKYVQHGWNLTGDAYRQDEDGYFWYESRTDDMIISSGYSVSGVEVENVLMAHPSVAECAVVAVPDEARGHIVKAFVVLAAGRRQSEALVRELQDYVKAELAPYKYPRAIEFVSELPRTLTGKLQRYRLRTSMTPTADRPCTFTSPTAGPSHGVRERRQRHRPRRLCRGTSRLEPGDAGDSRPAISPAEVRQALANVVTALAAAGARSGPSDAADLVHHRSRALPAHRRRRSARSIARSSAATFPAMSVVVVNGLIEDGRAGRDRGDGGGVIPRLRELTTGCAGPEPSSRLRRR